MVRQKQGNWMVKDGKIARVKDKRGKWKTTNKFGQYFGGDTRTMGSIKSNHNDFITIGKGEDAPDYKNCIRELISLWDEMDHVPVLHLFPIDPLHILLLGPINNLVPILRQRFTVVMDEFFTKHNLKSSEGIGGTMAGNK